MSSELQPCVERPRYVRHPGIVNRIGASWERLEEPVAFLFRQATGNPKSSPAELRTPCAFPFHERRTGYEQETSLPPQGVIVSVIGTMTTEERFGVAIEI